MELRDFSHLCPTKQLQQVIRCNLFDLLEIGSISLYHVIEEAFRSLTRHIQEGNL